jgi:UPF0271 protein
MNLKFRADLNCDLGESFGNFKIGDDEKMMPHITSANIACGFHAGDPVTMDKTVRLAKRFKVAIGAHPGLPDLMGFGRREMQLTQEELKTAIVYQVGALQGFAKAADVKLQHVKPHGALYNMATEDEDISSTIAEAVKALDSRLIVFAMPKSQLAKACLKAGIKVAHEFFADRAYNSDGSLVSRKQAGSIIQDARIVVERAVKAVKSRKVKTIGGKDLSLDEVQTICVHGDTPAAVKLAAALKRGLAEAEVKVESVGNFI